MSRCPLCGNKDCCGGYYQEVQDVLLEALKEVKSELDAYVPTCPLCGGSAASGHKYNCLWHVVNAAIRKVRGEE